MPAFFKVLFSILPSFCFIDLPENILQSLVNIYAEDTTVYRCTSKSLDDLVVVLSSDLALVDHWGKDWLVKLNTPKTKLVITEQTLNFHLSWCIGVLSWRLLALNAYWDSSSLQTSSGTLYIYKLLQNILEKWSDNCTTPRSICCYALSLQKLDQIKYGVSEIAQPSHACLDTVQKQPFT